MNVNPITIFLVSSVLSADFSTLLLDDKYHTNTTIISTASCMIFLIFIFLFHFYLLKKTDSVERSIARYLSDGTLFFFFVGFVSVFFFFLSFKNPKHKRTTFSCLFALQVCHFLFKLGFLYAFLNVLKMASLRLRQHPCIRKLS